VTIDFDTNEHHDLIAFYVVEIRQRDAVRAVDNAELGVSRLLSSQASS